MRMLQMHQLFLAFDDFLLTGFEIWINVCPTIGFL
tara:strand:- start:630 stop:734 length:105 start_codon:yes stop_codon:yes gene_type:complete